jgi:hypothetical protein
VIVEGWRGRHGYFESFDQQWAGPVKGKLVSTSVLCGKEWAPVP